MADARIHLFAGQDAVDAAAVTDLWTREAGLTKDEARRRIGEVLLVATDDAGALAGVSTVYLRQSEQLRMDLWHFRVFVAAAHRNGTLAVHLARHARDLLRARFVSGQDVRGAGMIFEVEHPGLRRRLDQAVWPRTDFAFIGLNARGAHVRVHYFPGALAPEPPA